MEITWPEDDCGAMIRFGEIISGWNVTVTDIDGDVTNVLAAFVGHADDEQGMLCLVGQVLDDDYELLKPRRHFWLRWDDIEKLEVH